MGFPPGAAFIGRKSRGSVPFPGSRGPHESRIFSVTVSLGLSLLIGLIVSAKPPAGKETPTAGGKIRIGLSLDTLKEGAMAKRDHGRFVEEATKLGPKFDPVGEFRRRHRCAMWSR